jgi:integrase
LDQVRDAIRRRHYSYRTEETYIHWIKRFIYFHQNCHPNDMGEPEVTTFLNHLSRECKVAASTQNQALSAIVFLYKETLGRSLGWLEGLEWARRPARVPTVLTAGEVQRLLAHLEGTKWIMASLLYGAGLRLRECLKLRVKDIDFEYRQIIVRDGKGAKDRVTVCSRTAWPRQRGNDDGVHPRDEQGRTRREEPARFREWSASSRAERHAGIQGVNGRWRLDPRAAIRESGLIGASAKDDVPDPVPQPQAARLELGLRPPCRPRRESVRGVDQQRLG